MGLNGIDFCETLQGLSIREREQRILAEVVKGNHWPISWTAVPVQNATHKGTLFVADDVLKIGTDEPVRLNVSARLSQAISDAMGWPLLTTKMADLVYQHATVRIEPQLQPADPTDRKRKGYSPRMNDIGAMIRADDDVESARACRSGLMSCSDKLWVRTNAYSNRPERARNYGFMTESAPYVSASGIRMWQTLGSAHGPESPDNSQDYRPVWWCVEVRPLDPLVETGMVPVDKVLRDPELADLLSSEGVLKFSRIPCAQPYDDTPPLPVEPKPKPTHRLDFDRVLKLTDPWMRGDDVKEWQAFLGVGADGTFGPQTDGATRQWQKNHGLVADGIVGVNTVAEANEVQAVRQDAGRTDDDPIVDDFVQAKNYTKANRPRASVKHIVIHTAEAAEKPTTAEALASWAAGPNAPRASWHFAVDADSVVQSVGTADVAWHAPGANRSGIGIEHAGYARQTAAEWDDEYSREMLARSARLVASLCADLGIPVQFVAREGLKRGERGITTHNEVSHAFKRSTHTDPGKSFPMERYLDMVREQMKRG